MMGDLSSLSCVLRSSGTHCHLVLLLMLSKSIGFKIPKMRIHAATIIFLESVPGTFLNSHWLIFSVQFLYVYHPAKLFTNIFSFSSHSGLFKPVLLPVEFYWSLYKHASNKLFTKCHTATDI